MHSQAARYTSILKKASLDHGFMGVGISKAEFMEDEAKKLEEWLGKRHHGTMGYMENHFDKRLNPTLLVPDSKSVVSLIYNYFPGDNNETRENSEPSFKISRYAYGEDYHHVIRKKLKDLLIELKSQIGDFHGRVFVDSAPVMERDWAKRSGLGWTGKNTMLIHPKKGSFFFLAEIILDVEFEYDHPIRDHCGTCTRCIDACPTEAILPNGYVLDASKCISYLTIELKSEIPVAFNGRMEDWIFGCDICQEVCPWNKFSTPHSEPAFARQQSISGFKKDQWIEMTQEIFGELFSRSALKRTRYEGIKRNILFAQQVKELDQSDI